MLPRLELSGAVVADAPARDATISASDWGEIGLLQTPTSRMAAAGDMRFHYSRVYPYGRATVMFQPLDWLEAGFRYTNISNRLYGPDIAGGQAYKDKSVDFKLRLAGESAKTPEVALGVIDIGGTGLFSSEYLVANKRYRDLDLSAGIAWGYLAGRGNIRNPLSLLSSGFDVRSNSVGSGGTLSTGAFFHGSASLFGGLQYQTPWEGLVAKIEYDGNNYQHEPQGNNQTATSPINFGLTYRYSPSIDFTAGIERGNTAMIGFTLHGALNKVAMPKLLDPVRLPIAPTAPQGEPAWSNTVAELKAQTQWQVVQIVRHGSDMQVVFDNPAGIYWQERIERAIIVLHRDAPASITRFVLLFRERGMPMSERIVQRYEWLADHVNYRAPAERQPSVVDVAPRRRAPGELLWKTDAAPYSFGLAPSFQQTVGGPNGFILYQLGASGIGEVDLGNSTWIEGKVTYRLADNYEKYTYDAPSALPRVRTYLRQYQTTAATTLPNLQITHVGQLSETQYYSAYAGYLEEMFAGVGGEWLYRPWHSPFAFGVDLNHVAQRDFRQNFDLQNAGAQTGYTVNTGHATLYWDTGWKSTHINLSAGQYLAGDRGVTVDVSRTFDNGVAVGAYATKTNVSAATFGEGSFDKGIYVSIPFDAILPFSSPSVGHFNWSPLTRDGGARLDRAAPLYALTGARDRQLLRYRATNSNSSSIQEESSWLPEPERSPLGDVLKSSGTLGRELLSGNYSDTLISSALLVAGSAVLDNRVDRWAQRHAHGRWNTLGSMASNIPIVLGAGTGLLWMGLGDPIASETAWTSIKSVGLSLVGGELVKTIVGRARPDANLGTHSFSPGSTASTNSSFPSLHMAVAFATVTPFAERYDAPWLYGVAAATAFGRIQQRQHFVSDTVAGSLLGYVIGSALSEEQRHRGRPQLSIGEDKSIRASWQF
ncbi:MAG: YjbH domain-containing protein [Rhodocyclaceae bacterium]|nr:YjbH domain-containing protein [Rhodocyclaceae bacterium]